MMDGVSLDPARHAGDLAVAAARALRAGDLRRAYALADRRCRIRPPPEANDFLLRAAARRALGDVEGADADTRMAATVEPDNPIATRWLLRASDDAVRQRAALRILASETDARLLGDAIAVLPGAVGPAVGAFTSDAVGMEGWIAWRGDAPLAFRVQGEGTARAVRLMPDPGHPLANALGSAARWRAPWPDGAAPFALDGFPPDSLIHGTVLFPPSLPQAVVRRRVANDPAAASHVTIILPVYDDLEATRLCLETLRADAAAGIARMLVAVDDASPNWEIAALLDEAAAAGDLVLLRNPVNLGFARSVNRALDTVPEGDVLLLNADTILPPGFLDRLARAAHAASDIGTVTPLSNNGENTSLPRRFVENPLPSVSEIAAIDAVAAEVNRGVTVDLPNGTGFCLYVRRDCLDAIGPLGTQFGRGYLEDVDLCLRAAMAGYRNVCATDVYVGHAGTRSFGDAKRALVVRNLALIEARYPGYERACAAFFGADPLAPARAAIDARMILRGGPYHLVVLGVTDDPDWTQAHVSALRSVWPFVLVARPAIQAARVAVTIHDAAGGFPQALRLVAPHATAVARLASALGRYPIASIEVPDPASVPAPVLGALDRLGRPRIAMPVVTRQQTVAPMRSDAIRRTRGETDCLAILAPPPSLASFALLRAIVRHWAGRSGLPALAILGETIDDCRLMASGPVLVSGLVPREDVPDLLGTLGATLLYLPCAAAPSHPHRALLLAGLPVALPGEAGASGPLPPDRLVIDPEAGASAVARVLADWALRATLERRAA